MTALTPAAIAAAYATRWFACHDMYANLPACDHCDGPGTPAVGPHRPAGTWNGEDSVSTEDDDDLGDES